MEVLFALFCIAIGLALVLTGFRMARFIIPLWGFLSGFTLSASLISDTTSTPLFSGFIALFVGLFVGAIFALLAYLYYSAAIIVLAGMLGYWAGNSFVMFLGLDPGVVSTVAGLAAGLMFGIIGLMMNAPKYVLILSTAIAGAVTAITGFLILFNAMPVESVSYASSQANIANSLWWTISTFAIAGLGILYQTRSTQDYYFEKWAIGGVDHSMEPMPEDYTANRVTTIGR